MIIVAWRMEFFGDGELCGNVLFGRACRLWRCRGLIRSERRWNEKKNVKSGPEMQLSVGCRSPVG